MHGEEVVGIQFSDLPPAATLLAAHAVEGSVVLEVVPRGFGHQTRLTIVGVMLRIDLTHAEA
jgi:hypothetical protein